MTIFAQLESDGTYRLMLDNFGMRIPAGWRLNKQAGFPINDFTFFDEGEARQAADKLQAYVNFNSKQPKKGKK